MARVGIVVQRYGADIGSGAEYYAKTIAEHLCLRHDVEVLTTTSFDYSTWEHHYDEGKTLVNGISVLRFRTESPREVDLFTRLSQKLYVQLQQGLPTDPGDEEKWFDAQGPFCPTLPAYLTEHATDYDVIIFITYLYYTSVRGLPRVAERSLFIPTAHDDIWIHLQKYQKLFQLPRFFGFLSKREQALVRHLFHNEHIPGDILGSGLDIPDDCQPGRFRSRFGIVENYLIFVGRIDISKGCKEAIDHFLAYKRGRPSPLKFVMIGKAEMPLPQHPDIVYTGFVSEQEKFDAISGALAMVAPATNESLCIALLEGFASGVPGLVNAKSDVLKAHCIDGNAGLYYDNREEFAGCVSYFETHSHQRNIMGANARKYVQENYTWDATMDKFDHAIRSIQA